MGWLGAIAIGLGSILGTGVFVSLALAARLAGAWLLPAVVLGGVFTLGLAMGLYLGVGLATTEPIAPLVQLAQAQNQRILAGLLGVGAIAATLGVLLNLLLGLSRAVLAMGRRQDVPPVFARLDAAGQSPVVALWAVAIAIIGVVLPGNLERSWSMSAFSILVYYGLTHWAARQLDRRAPLPYLGLAACGWLAFQVEAGMWGMGLGAIALLWLLKTLRRGKE